jgi:hypothetical protein
MTCLVPSWPPRQTNAQTQTWVSGVGDDANPAAAAPCKTFRRDIQNSRSGEINCLDPGSRRDHPESITSPAKSERPCWGLGTNFIIVRPDQRRRRVKAWICRVSARIERITFNTGKSLSVDRPDQ